MLDSIERRPRSTTLQYPAGDFLDQDSPAPASIDPLRQYLAALSAGEQGAMSMFYRDTVAGVRTVARAVLWTREDAEEVVSDVYVCVWRDPAAYDHTRGGVRTWLRMMTRHRAIDRLRRRRAVLSLDDERSLGNSLATPEPSAFALLAAHQAALSLHRTLLTLSPRRRRVLGLAFFRGLSHEEIAETLALPLGTVKSTLRRALLTLRQALQSCELFWGAEPEP